MVSPDRAFGAAEESPFLPRLADVRCRDDPPTQRHAGTQSAAQGHRLDYDHMVARRICSAQSAAPKRADARHITLRAVANRAAHLEAYARELKARRVLDDDSAR